MRQQLFILTTTLLLSLLLLSGCGGGSSSSDTTDTDHITDSSGSDSVVDAGDGGTITNPGSNYDPDDVVTAPTRDYLTINLPRKVESGERLIKEEANTKVTIQHYEKTGEKYVTLVSGKAYIE